MYYYEVLVGDMHYHGSEALTYASEEILAPGQVVLAGLRARKALGFIVRSVDKPEFTVKPLLGVAPFPAVPPQTLELLAWLRSYYPAPLGTIVRQFLPPTTVFPNAVSPTAESVQPKALPPLTSQQTAALNVITGAGSFLLHGVTGSGKSRIYLELARQATKNGCSAIILTPEIGLTTQLVNTFQEQLSSPVYVLHSQLTAATRRNIWYKILASPAPVVIIGPRSALFTPVANLGLIVQDESHDGAYKNESAPHYLTARVAARLAQLHQATFVSGSATPNVEDYYLAEQKQRPIIRMDELATASEHPPAAIISVDRKDRDQFSRSRLFSETLLAAIGASLNAGEQSLLFLNRRGTANVILCNNCGWQTLCPRCDLPLTYHGDEHRLRCHVCGYTTHLPTSCPECGNTDILLKSIGTKAVLSEIERLFPSARVQRFDTDVQKEDRLEQRLSELVDGSTDIIVGTQLIAKGLDLPRLSVVGIIAADSSLSIPDYTAAERTFQLVSQVAGRVGRGHRAGSVIVQSYNPGNATLQAAAHGDWQAFYASELMERRQYRFPPFTYLLKLNCLRATDASASSAAHALAQSLQNQFRGLHIDGPTPAFHPKERGKYNWQIVVKASRRQTLLTIIAGLPSGWNYDIDPINLL